MSCLSKDITQPFRFNKPFHLPYPNEKAREKLLLNIFSNPSIDILFDHSNSYVKISENELITDIFLTTITCISSLAREIALRTQGFSAPDVIKLVRDEWYKGIGDIKGSTNDKIKLSAINLVNNTMQAKPTTAITNNITSLMTSIPEIPTFVGINHILDRLNSEVSINFIYIYYIHSLI